MKTRIILAAVLTGLLFVDCEKNKTCTEEYAPEGVSISWTDYNTTTALRNYFYCHPKTIERHANAHDTLKVKGWVYVGNSGDARWWSRNSFISNHESYFILTGNDNHGEYDKIFHVHIIPEILDDFHSNFKEFFQKQLYITGTIRYTHHTGTSGCCYYFPIINATNIDTIP